MNDDKIIRGDCGHMVETPDDLTEKAGRMLCHDCAEYGSDDPETAA